MENPFIEIRNELCDIKNLMQSIIEKQNKDDNTKKVYSVKELASEIGTSELTIRNWIKEGKIIGKKMGRRVFIEYSQFEKGLDEIKSQKYKR